MESLLNRPCLGLWSPCRATAKATVLLIILWGIMDGSRALATGRRALFYGPTSSPNGLAETFVNSAGSTFAPIGPATTDSKVWTESEWSTKTTADFAQFDIIVFGDQPPAFTDGSRWNTAIANRAVWSAAVTGNALVLGTDPDYHAANAPFITPDIVQQALLFGASQTAYPQRVTGLYVALSHVDFGVQQGTTLLPERVELLAGIGDFMAVHVTAEAAAKIASHPVVDCVPDNYLPNWGYSAHQGFYSYPTGFKPLAIVTDAGHSTPGLARPCYLYPYQFCVDWALVYILARGSFNELTTSTCLQAGAPGQSRTITAKFRTNPILMPSGIPYVDVVVTPVDDDLAEGPETLVVTLQDDPNQPPTYAVGSPLQATITITDNEVFPVVTVTTSGSLAETSSGPPATATITFHLNTTLSQDLTIYFQLPVQPGDALLGADYSLDTPTTGEITIPAGNSSAPMLVTPLQDSRREGNEPVTVQILADPAYQLGNPSAVTLTIQDNDNVSLNFNYSITALGPANKYSHAYGINNLGRVMGDYLYTSPTWWRGFSWYNGSLTTIGVIQAYNCGQKHNCALSHGVAINDSGMVAGYGGYADGEGEPQDLPFRWTSGAPTGLDRLDSNQDYGNRAVAINNGGYIVGFSRNSFGKSHAVRWDANATAVVDLQTLAGQNANKESFAAGIGLSGKIVGRSMIGANDSTFHAFRTRPLNVIRAGDLDDLGNLPGVQSMNSEANGINDFDEVVGATAVAGGQYHAFWKDGYSGKNQGFIDLGVLSGDDQSVALGLNNAGHAVGYSLNTATGHQRAVVWFNNGVMWDLTAQVGAANGWVLRSATAINNEGWNVGWGMKDEIERAFLLVPNAY